MYVFSFNVYVLLFVVNIGYKCIKMWEYVMYIYLFERLCREKKV